MTYFRSIKSFREFFMIVVQLVAGIAVFVLKEAALSGGNYLGCLQSVKKKTEAPFVSLARSPWRSDRY